MNNLERLREQYSNKLNCSDSKETVVMLTDALEMAMECMTELKHHNNHTIEEEKWRIESTLAKIEKVLGEHGKEGA